MDRSSAARRSCATRSLCSREYAGLMSRPRLLLVDEPFIGLSPRMCDEVFGALQRINAAGVAVLLIEQNVRRSLQISARACVLRDGRVALAQDSASLLDSGAVERVFFGEHVAVPGAAA